MQKNSNINQFRIFQQACDIDRWTRVLLKLSFILFGYPRYSEEDLLKLCITPSESRDIKSYRTNLHFAQVVSVICQCVTIVKHYYFVAYNYAKISNIDTGNVECGDQKYKRFNCLLTNCTQFRTDVSLTDDLTRFPWLKLCNPMMAKVANPFIHLDFFGFIILSFGYYMVLMSGLVMPIQLYFKPLIHEIVTLQLASAAVLVRISEQIKNYLGNLRLSLKLYYEQQTTSVRIDDVHISSSSADISVYESSMISNDEELPIEVSTSDHSLSNPRTQAFIRDCFPLVRTVNYLTTTRGLFVARTILLCIVMMSSVHTAILASIDIIRTRKSVFDEIKEYTEKKGCFILTKECGHVDLDDVINDWDTVFWVEFFLTYIPFVLATSLMIVVGMIMVEELHIMHVEQMDRIRLILHVSDILKQHRGCATRALSGDFELGSIRRAHEANLRFVFGLTYLPPLSDIEIGNIAIDALVENGASLDAYSTLLSKVILGNRYLLSCLKQNQVAFNVLASYCYSISYALAIIYIFYGYKLRRSDNMAALLTVLSLLMTNATVSYMKRIQTKTRRLIRHMWRVVAATEGLKDVKIRHLRDRWLRQTVVFSTDGIVALKAFGIPVSHANITEILIWSSTLAVFLSY